MLAIPNGLDPDLLRSFVLIAEGGSFTRAGDSFALTRGLVHWRSSLNAWLPLNPLLKKCVIHTIASGSR